MMNESHGDSDSRRKTGGAIPGAPGIPAFTVSGPDPSAIPVLICVPHAGRSYPRTLLQDMRHPESSVLKLEDRYADKLALAVAGATGAGLVVANAPRAMIDLNRAPDDVDWEMFERQERPVNASSATKLLAGRARSGLGLVPRRLPGMGELWRRRQEVSALKERIAAIHEPYHATVAELLLSLKDRWGAALLLDLHSMPPLSARGGQAAPSFVIGDRFGASCHGSLVGAAFSHFAALDWEVAHNRPYAGGYVLERHAKPGSGIHAMQLEIDRSAYLDAALAEPGAGIGNIVDAVAGMVRRLAGAVVELGRSDGEQRWPQAAE